jgi:serine/threonine protein kinase HipA of HipAB toxin-antitoxin module
MSRAYHLIKMTEQEYAKYLLDKMTVDMTMDFEQTKQCAVNCIEEMISLDVDVEMNRFLKRTKEIILST